MLCKPLPQEMINPNKALNLAKNTAKTAIFASLLLWLACKSTPEKPSDPETPTPAVAIEDALRTNSILLVVEDKVKFPDKADILARNAKLLGNHAELRKRINQFRKTTGQRGRLLKQIEVAEYAANQFIELWKRKNFGVTHPSIVSRDRVRVELEGRRELLAMLRDLQIEKDGAIQWPLYRTYLLSRMALEKRELESLLDTKMALIMEDTRRLAEDLVRYSEVHEEMNEVHADFTASMGSLNAALREYHVSRKRNDLGKNPLDTSMRKRMDYAIERAQAKTGILLSRSKRFEKGINELDATKLKLQGSLLAIHERGKRELLENCRLIELYTEYQAIIKLAMDHELDLFEFIQIPQKTILTHCGPVEKDRYELSKHLARLDDDRSVLSDTNSSNWNTSLYHAMRKGARNLSGENFDPTAYSIDDSTGAVIILGNAYEQRPYTGRVYINVGDNPISLPNWAQEIWSKKMNGDLRLSLLSKTAGEVIIKQGVLTESHVYKTIGPYALESSHQAYSKTGELNEYVRFEHDALGQILRANRYDRFGVKTGTRDYRPEAMKYVTGAYEATYGTDDVESKLVLYNNGTAELFDRNGSDLKGEGMWIYADENATVIFPKKVIYPKRTKPSDDYPNQLIEWVTVKRRTDGELLTVEEFDFVKNEPAPTSEHKQRIFKSYINALPPNALLASRMRVGGELMYDRLDPSPFPLPFEGVLVDYFDRKRSLLKREEPVKSGLHHGNARWWYRHRKADGQQQLRFEAEYIAGDPEGRTAWYFADGSTEYEGFWANGLLERATSWDATGTQSGQVTAGSGTLTFFHPNGLKRLEENFTDGKLSGSKFWDEEGKPIESVDPTYIPARPRIIL